MEEFLVALLSNADDPSKQENIYFELQKLAQAPEFLTCLINIASNQTYSINIKGRSLILLRDRISYLSSDGIFNEDIFNFIKNQILPLIHQKLMNIFFEPCPAMVSQLAALCCLIHSRFHLLVFEDMNMILGKILENDQIFENAFLIIEEFIGNQNTTIHPNVTHFLYKFLEIPNLIRRTIKILNYFDDFSQVDNLFANSSKLPNDALVELCFYAFSAIRENSVTEGDRLSFMTNFAVNLLIHSEQLEESDILNLLVLIKSNLIENIGFNRDLLMFCIYKSGVDEDINYHGISRISLKLIKKYVSNFEKEQINELMAIIDSLIKCNDEISMKIILRIFSQIYSLFPDCTFMFELCMNTLTSGTLFYDSLRLLDKILKKNYDQKAFQLNLIVPNLITYFNNFRNGISDNDRRNVVTILVKILSKTEKIELYPIFFMLQQIYLESKTIYELYDASYLLATFVQHVQFFDLDENFVNFIFHIIKNFNKNNIPSTLHILSETLSKCNDKNFSFQIIQNVWPIAVEILRSEDVNDQISIESTSDQIITENYIIDFSYAVKFLCDSINFFNSMNSPEICSFVKQNILDLLEVIGNFAMPQNCIAMKRNAWLLLHFISTLSKDEDIKGKLIIVLKTIFIFTSQFMETSHRKECLEILISMSVTLFHLITSSQNTFNVDIEFINHLFNVLFSAFDYQTDEKCRLLQEITICILLILFIRKDTIEIAVSMLSPERMQRLLLAYGTIPDSQFKEMFATSLRLLFECDKSCSKDCNE
ncbi:hypothetical protein TRFO_16997 [Tritrichomonas foetus]|uniref:Importin N-terminal domain-containing protein n=1 Tax=Tritrichomonas foetus TaxID=1144522 RepID=A0A1J4KPB8_9EUKA|nr:hypothetical protein TRFO_16997 [Tritrichomonas foetus]|eukprot:OHT12946.1 hypothetical protein TRFO_16997 [Tritrichomonas foetus]